MDWAIILVVGVTAVVTVGVIAGVHMLFDAYTGKK